MTPTLETTVVGSTSRNIVFLRGLVANPRDVASLFPSSRALARLIAAQVDPERTGTVVELGPGTGSVTKALLERGVDPSRLLLVERDANFVRSLRKTFPAVRVTLGNALNIGNLLPDEIGPVSAIVSGLPLLNFEPSVRQRLVQSSLSRLAPKAPFIQLSFGWKPPAAASREWRVRRAGVTYRNLPPATVWVYSKLS